MAGCGNHDGDLGEDMLGSHSRWQTVDRALVASVLLTLGQIFWWHNDSAHRSVFSLVMTILWLSAVTLVMTRPLQRMWREADEIDRQSKAEKAAARTGSRRQGVAWPHPGPGRRPV